MGTIQKLHELLRSDDPDMQGVALAKSMGVRQTELEERLPPELEAKVRPWSEQSRW